MSRLLAFVFLFTLSSSSFGAESLWRVSRVMDGDTLKACSLRKSCVTVRVNALNTPEKRLCKSSDMPKMSSCEPCAAGASLGVQASKYASALFARQPQVRLKTIGKDKYGRTVADVILWDGRNYADVIKDKGLGADYPCPNGRCKKRPRPWCPGN